MRAELAPRPAASDFGVGEEEEDEEMWDEDEEAFGESEGGFDDHEMDSDEFEVGPHDGLLGNRVLYDAGGGRSRPQVRFPGYQDC